MNLIILIPHHNKLAIDSIFKLFIDIFNNKKYILCFFIFLFLYKII